MRNSQRMTILIFLYIIIGGVVVGIFGMYLNEIIQNSKKIDYPLGELTRPGYVGVEIHYDREPVDVCLVTPEKKIINAKYADYYQIDEENHVITVLMDSDNLGFWNVEFNKKTNHKITYLFVTKPSPTLYIDDVDLLQTDDGLYIQFTPLRELRDIPESDATPINEDGTTAVPYEVAMTNVCKYSMTINGDGFSLPMNTGYATLNEQNLVRVELPDRDYEDRQYVIRLSLRMMDDEDNHTLTNLNVIIHNQEPEIIEEYTETEETNDDLL